MTILRAVMLPERYCHLAGKIFDAKRFLMRTNERMVVGYKATESFENDRDRRANLRLAAAAAWRIFFYLAGFALAR